MIVSKVAFGNSSESYIESRFSEKFNIIFSNDNNKGKTLLLQGLMYAIGNEPIFPYGFNYQDYYFFVECVFDNKKVSFLRKKNTIIIKGDSIFQVCHTVSDFKYFINKYVFKLPTIVKDNHERIVEPSLFYETFFIGQDKRNTSNIISKGQYNKKDFLNMLYSLASIQNTTLSIDEVKNIKDKIKSKESKQSSLKKKISILKKKPDLMDFSKKFFDKETFDKKESVLSLLHKNISGFKRSRTRESNRKHKLQLLLTELRSLNQNIEQGSVACSDCGSENILYKSKDVEFDISNKYVRSAIFSSIEENIALKIEVIDELTRSINNEQDKLNNELESTPPEMRDILLFKDELTSVTELDNEHLKLYYEIKQLKETLGNNEYCSDEMKDKQSELISALVRKMNEYYGEIDPSGNLVFTDLFTKNDETYSGSEEQEFYFCKVMALRDYFDFNFPIIIDSFRDGELSSKKEEKMIEFFKSKPNQIIVTSTLKDEEYDTKKYSDLERANIIDYSVNNDSKILSEKHNIEFSHLVHEFNITLS